MLTPLVSLLRRALQIQEGIGLEDTVAIESVIRAAPACDTVSAFFEPDGPQKLMFVYQPGEPSAEGGDSAPASLQLTSGELERLTGKCVYFVRLVREDEDEAPTWRADHSWLGEYGFHGRPEYHGP